MKRFKWNAQTIALSVIFFFVGLALPRCGWAGDDYRFGTSKPGGAFYPISAAIGQLAGKHFGDKVTLHTGGGTSNVIKVGKKELEFGITYSTSVYDASVGRKPYKERLADLRIAAVLYPQVLLWTVWADSDIKTYKDLKGKRVNVLPRFFSTHYFNQQVLSALGMSFNDLSKTLFLGLSDAVANMKDGHSDALLLQGDARYAPLIQLMAHKPIRFLSFTDEEIAKIRKIQPAVVPDVLEKKHFKQAQDINTMRAYLVIVSHKGVSENLVNKMAKVIYGNVSHLGTVNVNLKNLDAKDAIQDLGIPRHPGLSKYLKEKGLL